MKRAAFLFTILVLGGCSSSSMPDLESMPPAAQASGEAQADGVALVRPESQAQAQPDEKGQPATLNPEQRADVEESIRKGVTNPHSATIGRMTARVTKYSPRSYVVCGWVDPGSGGSGGYKPFVVMYFPTMRRAVLIGLGDTDSKARAVRQKCIAENVPLDA